jgi:hypothetical protein
MTELLTNASEIGLRRDLGKPPPRHRHTGQYRGETALARARNRVPPAPLPKKVKLPDNVKWVRAR